MTESPMATITVDGSYDTEAEVYQIVVDAEDLVLVTINFGQLGSQVVDQILQTALGNWRAAYVPLLEAQLAGDAPEPEVIDLDEVGADEGQEDEHGVRPISPPDENDENGRLA